MFHSKKIRSSLQTHKHDFDFPVTKILPRPYCVCVFSRNFQNISSFSTVSLDVLHYRLSYIETRIVRKSMRRNDGKSPVSISSVVIVFSHVDPISHTCVRALVFECWCLEIQVVLLRLNRISEIESVVVPVLLITKRVLK